MNVVVITHSGTRIVKGYPVQIGNLTGVFAATPSIDKDKLDDSYVITHIKSGQAIPMSPQETIAEAVEMAERVILEVGKIKYERAIQSAIDEYGSRIEAAYEDLDLWMNEQ